MKAYYEDDLVRLFHGDCREITEWLDADVLVTDPPYGMALRSSRSGEHGDLNIAGDNSPELRDTALEMWGGGEACTRLRPLVGSASGSHPRPAHLGQRGAHRHG